MSKAQPRLTLLVENSVQLAMMNHGQNIDALVEQVILHVRSYPDLLTFLSQREFTAFVRCHAAIAIQVQFNLSAD